MLYSHYYISVPSYMSYSDIECPIQYFVKKYGYSEYLSSCEIKKMKNNHFLIKIPYNINNFFIYCLTEDEKCVVL